LWEEGIVGVKSKIKINDKLHIGLGYNINLKNYVTTGASKRDFWAETKFGLQFKYDL